MVVNDSGATSDSPVPAAHRKPCDLCTILHADVFTDTATHMIKLEVPDRYLVVRVNWNETQVYIRNVYTPVDSQARDGFFDSLP